MAHNNGAADGNTPSPYWDDDTFPDVPKKLGFKHLSSIERYEATLRQKEGFRRRFYWSLRITEEAEDWAVKTYPEGIRNGYMIVGPINPERDEIEFSSFGPIFYEFGDKPILGHVIGMLKVDSFEFPIVRRIVSFERHINVIGAHSKTGMIACWAAEAGRRDGWLTARHLIQDDATGLVPPDLEVQFFEKGSSRGFGGVIKSAPGYLDAALLYTTLRPTRTYPLPYTIDTPPGLNVEITQANGGKKQGQIMGSFYASHLINSSKWPLRFTMSQHADAGDSGSLITVGGENSGQEFGSAVGIYLGSQWEETIVGAKEEGVGLSINQIRLLMGLKLLRHEWGSV